MKLLFKLFGEIFNFIIPFGLLLIALFGLLLKSIIWFIWNPYSFLKEVIMTKENLYNRLLIISHK